MSWIFWHQNDEPDISQLTNNQIVDQIIDGTIPYLDHKKYTYTTATKPDANIDDSRELKDICTEIVVNIFMESAASNFNFLREVYSLFQNSITYYIDQKGLQQQSIIFVYKGGNILRFLSNEFLRELPGAAANDIHTYYKQFFKRSDADFSIYVDPRLPEYDTVFNDMVLLSFVLQVKLRSVFRADLTRYFDYYKYTDQYMETLLIPYINKLKNASVFTDEANKTYNGKVLTEVLFEVPNNRKYIGKHDIGVQSVTDKSIVIFDIGEATNSIYVQSNNSLDFKAGKGRIKFTLVRSKINFNLIFADNKLVHMGGELIDVSLPHKLDSKVAHFFDNLKRYIHRYEMKNDTGDKIQFTSYSIEYLTEDLEFILFEFVERPWLAPKYDKRVNRLMYLYMIDIFNKVSTNEARKNIMEELKKLATDPNKSITASAFEYLLLAKLINHIFLLNKIVTNEDRGNFMEFLKVIDTNVNLVMGAFNNILEYCSTDGSIKLKKIYEGDMAAIV